MKRIVRNGYAAGAAVAGSILAVIYLHCTTRNPIAADTGVLSIKLGLDRQGVTRATYTGSDIRAFVEFSDTVVCTFDNKQPEHLQVYTGSGRFRIPDEAILGTRLTTLEIPLYWIKRPTNRDSQGIYFDTVFIEVGLQRSNVVRVDVTNMSPSIDSFVIADSGFAVYPNIYGTNQYLYTVGALEQIPMRVVSRDPDNDQLVTEWRAAVHDTLLVRQADDRRIVYRTPLYNFRDTLAVIVSDGKLGNRQINIILQRTSGLDVLSIDSIRFGVLTLKDLTPVTTLALPRIDSAVVRAFYSNRAGLVVNTDLSAYYGSITPLGSTLPNQISGTYRSGDPRGSEPLTIDTVLVIDTLMARLTIPGNDTLQRLVVLQQVPANYRPVIDSVAVAGVVSRLRRHTALAGDTVTLQVWSTDRNGGLDVPVVRWNALQGRGTVTRFAVDTAWYVMPDSALDTVVVTVADTMGFVARDTLWLLANRAPLIDSLGVGDSMYRAGLSGSVPFSYRDTANAHFAVRLFGHDPDGTDVPSVQWTVRSGAQTGKIFTTATFEYRALNRSYADTARCIYTDPHGKSDTALIYFSIE